MPKSHQDSDPATDRTSVLARQPQQLSSNIRDKSPTELRHVICRSRLDQIPSEWMRMRVKDQPFFFLLQRDGRRHESDPID
jgi:hypothetical protein